MLITLLLPGGAIVFGSELSQLLYSNSPERVTEPTLLYQAIVSGPARLLYHHLNGTDRAMVLEVHLANLSESPTALKWQLYSYQHSDPTSAGHFAVQQYWLDRQPALATPAIAGLADQVLAATPWPAGTTISGLASMHLSQPAMVRVVARSATADGEPLLVPASTTVFPLADLYQEITYAVPRAPFIFSVGRGSFIANSNAVLRGNYGVVHSYHITVDNPTDNPQGLSIFSRQAGGVSRAFVLLDDELLTMPYSLKYEKQLLARRLIPAQDTVVVSLSTMPQPGSNMPIDFSLESDSWIP